MPREHFSLDAAPADEEAADIGEPLYRVFAHKECRAYLQAIRRRRGMW
jgi:hypothetical protein